MAAEIRRATPQDRADIGRLLAAQLAEHRIHLEKARLARAIEGVLADPGRGFFLVAREADRCVGVAYVSLIWALEHGGQAAWLEELYVEPGLRQAGVGTALLEGALGQCAALGCGAVDLEIDADHERVWSLYARHGFTALPRRRIVKRLGQA
jgi:GNAT superfamily N-acetyltransferase